MYVCKGENSRAVAAGLVLAVRRPPDVQTMKKSIKQNNPNLHYLRCTNMSKNTVSSVSVADSAKLERIKKVRFKLLCIVNYKVNYAISIVNYAIPRAFKSLSAIIF